VDFRILYTRPALTDLHQILAWSWENHPATAECFVSALLNHVDLLRSFPRLGEPVKGFLGVRRILHSSLHVYYRTLPQQKTVEVLHFWYVARDLPVLS
jgi:plasmid stabilization system protein ParE